MKDALEVKVIPDVELRGGALLGIDVGTGAAETAGAVGLNITLIALRQYRTKIVLKMRREIFRQIVYKFRRHTDVCQGISVQDDGKYPSRFSTKTSGDLCAVLP